MARKTFRLLAWAAWLAATPLCAQGIRATREDEKTIRVVAPGRFETAFTMRKGFGAVWFDLAHDPEKKLDLAPVLDENGFLWVKAAGPGMGDGSWYANPPQKMELLEAGPVRVRVRLSGPHRRYGRTDPKAVWPDLGFEQTWTVYPTGNAYVDYALVTEKPVPLHHFLLIIKSTGAWGKRGKPEVHCASEAGAARPTAEKPSAFALEWSDGPTWFQDILMVLYRGRYSGTYWDEGFEDKDVRAGLNLLSRWPDADWRPVRGDSGAVARSLPDSGKLPSGSPRAATVPKGRDHIFLLMRFADDMNGAEAAAPYAADYRSPDRLVVTEGKLVTNDEGDLDADGFNEAEGCYVVEAGPKGVELTLHGAKTPRLAPAFKIKGWGGDAPKALRLGDRELAAGTGFVASAMGGTGVPPVSVTGRRPVPPGVLLLQILEDVRPDATLVLPR